MGRLKKRIRTNISFGTEMKFKMKGMIKYTNIPGPLKGCMKVGRYPHHQPAILANYPVVVS